MAMLVGRTTLIGVFVGTAILLGARAARAEELPGPAREFLEGRCLSCHDAASKKGGLDFAALPADLHDAAVEAKWTFVYDRVRRGEMPPGTESPPPAAERTTFLQSLGGFLRAHDIARRSESGRVVLRRLNRVEYENTIHDLLAIDTPLADLLPPDAEAHGFDNVAEALRLSSTQIESYLAAADQAFDAAVRLGPKPPVKKQRYNYLEMQHVKDALAKVHGQTDKNGNKHQQIFRALPDAFVMFHNDSYGMTLLRDTRAPATGLYRVRLSAYAHQTAGTPVVAARVYASRYISRRSLAAFDLVPDRPRQVEVVGRLEQAEVIDIGAAGCGIARDGSNVYAVGAEKFRGTGIAIQWVEVEGPLLDSWPPPSVQKVFADIPVKPLAKPRGGRAFEIASSHPEEDVARIVTRFAGRAFRRPITDKDMERYVRLAREALTQGVGFEQAVRRACLAILSSPEFLFLLEKPGRLEDYALASRLSYFLWSTMPDDELLELAAKGKLHEPEVLWAQTERLLQSPKAGAFSRNFCGQWLGLRSIDATTPDRRLYPEFDDLLQQAMVRETELFFEELLRADLGAAALIDSDFAILNRRLAEHYGIPGVTGEQFRKVILPPGSHRGGILTQASILKVTANGTTTSPVVRGAWVLRRVLGRPPQPPPPNVGSIEPDTRGASTIREQLARHRRSASCAACHQYIDPAGFALENYDVIGGWRDWYRSQGKGKPVANPLTGQNFQFTKGPLVDARGKLADGRRFRDLDELKTLLLREPDEIARNLVNHLVTYATGAGVTFADREEVDAILRRAKPKAYGVRTLVHEIVQSPLFQTK